MLSLFRSQVQRLRLRYVPRPPTPCKAITSSFQITVRCNPRFVAWLGLEPRFELFTPRPTILWSSSGALSGIRHNLERPHHVLTFKEIGVASPMSCPTCKLVGIFKAAPCFKIVCGPDRNRTCAIHFHGSVCTAPLTRLRQPSQVYFQRVRGEPLFTKDPPLSESLTFNVFYAEGFPGVSPYLKKISTAREKTTNTISIRHP